MDQNDTKTSVSYNMQKVAERSARAWEELIEFTRVKGFEVIRKAIVDNPPPNAECSVDNVLVMRAVFDKIMHEYLKLNLKKIGGDNAYIISTDNDKLRKPS